MAGFEVTFNGRFWLTAEANATRIRESYRTEFDAVLFEIAFCCGGARC